MSQPSNLWGPNVISLHRFKLDNHRILLEHTKDLYSRFATIFEFQLRTLTKRKENGAGCQPARKTVEKVRNWGEFF